MPSAAPDILTPEQFAAITAKGFRAVNRRSIALNKGGSVDLVTGGGRVFAVVRFAKLKPETTAEITKHLTLAREQEARSAEALQTAETSAS